MYIESIEVHNYKSYLQSGKIEFKPGFNIIVGQNSAGKTALLEALSLSFGNKPHRSLHTIPTIATAITHWSKANARIRCSGEELFEGVLIDHATFHMVMPNPTYHFDYILKSLQKMPELQISATVSDSQVHFFETPGLYESSLPQPDNISLMRVQYNQGNYMEVGREEVPKPNVQDIGVLAFTRFRSRFYLFKAERFNIGKCFSNVGDTLDSSANNLPSVLHNLQANPSRFGRYNAKVREILPNIKQVSIRPSVNSEVEILIWPIEPDSERIDLAMPLNQCGTGVAQVLAILYVVMNSDSPRVLLIDEPQSFLHPGAVRKLIEVLKEHPEHQYILATHSPTIINATNPATLTLVQQENSESKLYQLDPKSANALRVLMADVGASLSDTFGADSVLWVEGATEEICFKLILQAFRESLHGTVILGVKNTGDLVGKQKRLAETIFDIYAKLSGSQCLLPPAIGFVFDAEGLNDIDKAEIAKRCPDGAEVKFLGRRLYENYLLDSEAISATLLAVVERCKEEIEGFTHEPIDLQSTEAWMEANRKEAKYYKKNPYTEETWRQHIHGAELLESLFQHIFDGKVPYKKTTHSVELTRWILDNNKELFSEAVALLKELLSKQIPVPLPPLNMPQ